MSTTWALRISDGVLAAMERDYILREDAEQAVAGAEATGNRFLETESGHFVAAWRPRHVTFWVRYSVEGDERVLHDAWCHRMDVPGAGGGTPCQCAAATSHGAQQIREDRL